MIETGEVILSSPNCSGQRLSNHLTVSKYGILNPVPESQKRHNSARQW